MFAVIFEVQPREDRWSDYLDLARQLKPKLEAIDGFIDNERFESTRTRGRVLSLSIWRDEKAVVRWRTQADHHGVQEKGRFDVFEDYHLRVGEVTADSAPPQGLTVEITRFDETQIATAKSCTITELSGRNRSKPVPPPEAVLANLQLDSSAHGLLGHEVFESIHSPGKLLILASWQQTTNAAAWKPIPFDGAYQLRHRQVRVIRDYGMTDRREAPQFFAHAATVQ